MSLLDFRREQQIRRVIRMLARQRVAMILQPGNVLVIENSPTLPYQEEALRTCLLRGWVEVLHDSVPHAALPPDMRLSEGPPMFNSQRTIYRLTEAGWQVINRTQTWVVATFAVAFASLIATVLAILRG
jgi:hypothetical protein